MRKIYEKSEWNFVFLWIGLYVVCMSSADRLSGVVGIGKVVTAPAAVGLCVVLFRFLRGNGLTEEYGLCSFRGRPRDYLYFLPFLLLLSVNLWNGAAIRTGVLESVLFAVTMLCVGFLEEVIFRGLLFRALCRQGNLRLAILISSVTFGAGHIVNLLGGRELVATLLQTVYATAIVFLFTMVFYRGKSLWPCIVIHGLFNTLSLVGVEYVREGDRLRAVCALCAISFAYALWIVRRVPDADAER